MGAGERRHGQGEFDPRHAATLCVPADPGNHIDPARHCGMMVKKDRI
jgi:hypothetical protein